MFKNNEGASLVVVFLSVVIAIIIGFFVYQQFFMIEKEKDVINFSRFGNLVMNNPGLEEDYWYIIYEAPGKPAENIKLIFNNKSICNNETNSCLDLIQGQRVGVKGFESNGFVLVRELNLINEENIKNLNDSIIIDWDLLISYLNDCLVKSIIKNSKKEVYIVLKDESKFFTIEPKGEFLEELIREKNKKCDNIHLTIE